MSLKDTSKNTKAFEAMFTEMLKNKGNLPIHS